MILAKRREPKPNIYSKRISLILNNIVFGKTIEKVHKHANIHKFVVTEKKQALKLASKPTYVNQKIFNENLVAVHKIKETLTLNRPAYVGMRILDRGKTFMYDFHYNYKNKNTVTKQNYYSKTRTV